MWIIPTVVTCSGCTCTAWFAYNWHWLHVQLNQIHAIHAIKHACAVNITTATINRYKLEIEVYTKLRSVMRIKRNFCSIRFFQMNRVDSLFAIIWVFNYHEHNEHLNEKTLSWTIFQGICSSKYLQPILCIWNCDAKLSRVRHRMNLECDLYRTSHRSTYAQFLHRALNPKASVFLLEVFDFTEC